MQRMLRRSRCRTLAALLPVIVLAVLAGPARADSVWTISGGANAKPFERKNVKIDGMTGDALSFRSINADRAAEPRPLKEIWRVQVDDEPALNAAETAFVGQKWDDAVANYQRTIATSRKDWAKQYATLRLVAAAEKSGKFSAAATAYAALVQRDLNAADSAKPAISPDAKAELPGAIAAVKAAVANRALKPPQKSALQAFLAEMYIANGQLKEAEALSGKPGGAVPAAPGARSNAAAGAASGTNTPRERDTGAGAASPNRGQIDLKLQLALAAIKQKKYQEAIDAIDTVAANLNEPQQQADALFYLAEAKAGLAGDDADKLKDAALAHMRVVAHFKSQPDAPHVAESVLRAGELLERAKLLPDALAAFQAVQADYKDGPQAQAAADAAARVQRAIEAAKG
jgi:TolA-binding protein